MSHRVFRPSEAHKLEDPQRQQWLPTAEVVRRLRLSPGMKVADVGAGTGYFSFPIAEALGDTGHVFAIDLQPEMLDLLRQKLEDRRNVANISLHQGSASKLPLKDGGIDLVFLANVWHEIDDVDGAFSEAARVSQQQGRIAILDWSPEFTSPPGPPQEHRIPAATVMAFLGSKGCRNLTVYPIGRYSYLVTAEFPS